MMISIKQFGILPFMDHSDVAGEQVKANALGSRPWGCINTLYLAIRKRDFNQKF